MQPLPWATAGEDESKEIDLLGLFATLIDHRWLMAAVTGSAMATGAAYAVLATPVFQATALLQVEGKKSDWLSLSDSGSMLGKASSSATEIELIQSRAVIGQTIDNLKLDTVIRPMYFPVVGEFLARRYQKKNPGKVADALLGMNGYAWGGESLKLLKLEVPDAQLGKQLTLTAGAKGHYTLVDDAGNLLASLQAGVVFERNGVVLQIEALRANPGTRFSVMRIPHLNSILRYQRDLNVAERGKDSGMISLTLDSTEPDQAIKVLNEIATLYVRQNAERIAAEAAHSLALLKEQLPAVKQALQHAANALNAFKARSQSVDISLETKGLLEQIISLDTRLSELKLQQAEMDRKFTAQHPAQRALLIQIAELTRQQQRLASKAQTLPATQQQLLSLTREVEVSTAIYTQLLSKLQQLEVMRAVTQGNARVVDAADVNVLKPVKPKKPLIVLIATLFGGFLAVTLVLLRKAFNRGVQNPAVIEQLGLPVYASIPCCRAQKNAKHARSRERGSDGAGALFLARTHPADPALEALRSVRTRLHFARCESPDNRIMLCGPSPKAAKAFVCVNLAAVIAQAGQRVLVIDVDMRAGFLHEVLGLCVNPGLCAVLADQCTLEAAIQPTCIDNLDFLSRGPIPPNPSELLMRPRFTELLSQASGRYDVVILDTPSLQAVTDAAIVGRQSGTNLIVTRYGVTTVKDIQHSVRQFAQHGIVLAGAVFEGVEHRACTNL